MKRIPPSCPKTIVHSSHEWAPTNFEDFIIEMGALIGSCGREKCPPLFRGQSERRWVLHSSFARTCKKRLLGLEPHDKLDDHIAHSVEYHQVLLSLLLFKFDILTPPLPLSDFVSSDDESAMDPLFELMRLFQQHPERDHPMFPGSIFIDWTQSEDVALFFANLDRTGDGAFWICDTQALQTYPQQLKVEKIIELMVDHSNNGQGPGIPLMFNPPKQFKSKRARNQKVVYLAQMDMTCPFEDIWIEKEHHANTDGLTFMKLILPNGSQNACKDYLAQKEITDDFIFAREHTD